MMFVILIMVYNGYGRKACCHFYQLYCAFISLTDWFSLFPSMGKSKVYVDFC